MSEKQKALQIFDNQDFGKVRCLMIDDVVWFVGKDVAKALGYENGSRDVNRHVDDEDKLKYQIGTSGQRREMTLINESGLYSLILSSKLPKAKEFKHWVTSEVLPSIRKTGVYVHDKTYLKWLDTRGHGKFSRKQETNAIKIFIEYARAQGCNWDDGFFYGNISIWCNVGAGIAKKNGRDNTNIQQLNTIDLLEGTIVKNILIDGMAAGLHWTQILAQVMQQINKFLEITFQANMLLQ